MKSSTPTRLLRDGKSLQLRDRRFVVHGLLGQGGSGQVYEVHQGNRRFALKLFFPYYQLPLFSSTPTQLAADISESLAFQKREHEFLSCLDHPNIVGVHDCGELKLTKAEQARVSIKGITALPVIVTDFVDGLPLANALSDLNPTRSKVVRLLSRLASALEYLHGDRHYMHVDIKSGNVLVRRTDFEPVLIDFALCKNLNLSEVSAAQRTRLLGDWDLFPKNLPTDHELKRIKESAGTKQELFDLAFPALDLFQFGKMLHAMQPHWATIFARREREYLAVLADQLTQWSIVTSWGVRDLRPRLERLAPEHFSAFGVPELTAPTGTERTIMLPPGIGVPITERVSRIIDSRSFRRLAYINQLSLLWNVYPSGGYKRAVHVLFSYELARQMSTHLYGAPLFRLLFDVKSTQQLLAVALLHDINHFPFLHIFQESGIPSLDTLRVLDMFCDGDATGENAKGQPSIYDLLADIGIDEPRFKRLVFSKHHEQAGDTPEVDQVISSIINSGVDVDKLSYLFMDSYFTGIRYGSGIDYSGILKAATIGRVPSGGAIHIAFTDRAMQALENVVMTRYWSFRSVYWHHTNRAIMAMVLYVVRRLYVEAGRDVRDYVLGTMWKGDAEAVRYLNAGAKAQFGGESILSGLIEDRTRLYKRLYTVRTGMGDDADDEIYARVRRLDYVQESKFRLELACRLGEYLSKGTTRVIVGDHEVLVDIPRREMDTGGNVYLSGFGRDHLTSLSNFSDPVRSISLNYEKLTKRVRFFISPEVGAALGTRQRESRRMDLQKLISGALTKTLERSQVT